MERQRFKTEFSEKSVKTGNNEKICFAAQLLQQLMLD